MTKEDLIKYKEKLSKLSEKEEKLRNMHLRKIANGEIQGPMVGYASIDKPWLKEYEESDLKIEVSSDSPYQLFEQTCKKYNDDIAYTYILDDKLVVNIKFKDVLKRVNDLKKSLLGLGCKQGDVILTILPNTPESKELMWAAFGLGIRFYPISPLLPDAQVDKIIKQNRINNLFIFEGFEDKYKNSISSNHNQLEHIISFNGMESLNPILRKTIQLVKKIKTSNIKKYDSKRISFESFLKYSKLCSVNTDDYYKYDENNVILIEGTSGTTGIPKGVCITGKNIMATYKCHTPSFIQFEHGDRFLDIMNNSLAYGATTAIMTSLKGIRTYFRPGFTMDPYDDIIKYNINQVIGGPVHVKNLNDHLEKKDKINHIKNWVSGGAPLDKSLESKVNKSYIGYNEKEVKNSTVIVRQGYGATENQGVISYEKSGSYKYGAMGVPLFMENIGVFENGTDIELPYGVDGEICVSGPTIMKEYLNNPEETNKVMIKHSDGAVWLHLKDLGHVDNDGHLVFADRIKNIFGRNGMNVHPTKITEFIKSLNIIDDCVTTGVFHPEEQMVPVVFVKLKNESLNLQEVNDYILCECFKNLEESSIPYEIRFVKNIPLNAGGKPDVAYLIEQCGIDYSKQNKREKVLSIEKVNSFRLK
ncbi:MAG: acyl--CoA ligase [Bacilli bacterium]|nr:acyl--CoA ligase [Bacilli bacterium]